MNRIILLLLLSFALFQELPAQDGTSVICGHETGKEAFDGAKTDVFCWQQPPDAWLNFIAEHADDVVPIGANRLLRIRTNVILMQNADGEGNFSPSTNPEHQEFLDELFVRINQRLRNNGEECGVSTAGCGAGAPTEGYADITIEFVPVFREIRDEFGWNHLNDVQPNVRNSCDKDYLNYIRFLAEQEEGYETGFDVIVTTDGNAFYEWDPEAIPLWQMPGGYEHLYDGAWYSSYPQYNLDHPALWHAPDMYLWYQIHRNGWHGPWINQQREFVFNWWTNVFIHEYGHYFNLCHADNDCPGNYMVQGGQDRTRFSACQIQELYESLMTKNLRDAVICEERIDYNLTVDNQETWSMNMKVYGDIVVEDGGVLEITGELHLQPNAVIFVKRGGELQLNGGTITGCGDYWTGIRVEGFADFNNHQQTDGGIVRLSNGAVIENARQAISMNNTHLGWPALQDFYGGLVIADGATFRNCWRAVEFMRYATGGGEDQSSFTNCTFENLRLGVTIWGTDGVAFDNCTFTGVSDRAVITHNAETTVINSTFTDTRVGIDVIATAPWVTSGTRIGTSLATGNTFSCEVNGVHVESSANIGMPTIMRGNNFNVSNVGLLIQGTNETYIVDNDFDCFNANLQFVDTGTERITVKGNRINNGFLGATVFRQNDRLLFEGNCFDNNSNAGIRLLPNSTMDEPHGFFDQAAMNRFNPGNFNWRAIRNEVDNNDPNITYQANTLDQSSNFHPSPSLNVDVVLATVIPSGTPCSGDNFNDEVSWDKRQVFSEVQGRFISDSEIMTTIKTLEKEYVDLRQQDPASGAVHLADLKALKLRKAGLVAGLHISAVDHGNLMKAASYLLSDWQFEVASYGFGIYLQLNELGLAEEALSKLPVNSADDRNFLVVQRINLAFLNKGTLFQLSSREENTLFRIGQKAGRSAGYARALYLQLTGKSIEIDIPAVAISSNATTEELEAEKQQLGDPVITAYPNPVVNGDLSLHFSEELVGRRLTVVVLDQIGNVRRSLTQTVSKQLRIKQLESNTAFYYVVVKDAEKGGLISTLKVLGK